MYFKSITVLSLLVLTLQAGAQILEGDSISICLGESLVLNADQSYYLPSALPNSNLVYTGEHAGHQYYTNPVFDLWNNSQSACSQFGGYIVCIGDASENNWVVSTGGGQNQWIGFSDQVSEGNWQWINGEPVNYLNWNPGEPNNAGDEDFGIMGANGAWNDIFATATAPCLCEFDLYPASIVWSTGDNTPSTNAELTASQWVYLSIDLGGVITEDSIFVSVTDVSFDAFNDESFSCGDLVLQAPAGYDALTWSDGSGLDTLVVSNSGAYSLTATMNGCSWSDATNVSILNLALASDTNKVCVSAPSTFELLPFDSAPLEGIALDGFSYAGEFNGHYYYLASAPANFADAAAASFAAGGYLLTVNDASEEAYVSSLVAADQLLWIGLTDEASEGSFYWLNGEPVTYTNWGAGEPNNAGNIEHYAQMNWNGAWNDSDGSGEHLFVCEFDGLPGLEITWSNGTSGVQSEYTSATSTVLSVEVTNGVNTCVAQGYLEISMPSAEITVSAPSCFGGNDGVSNIVITGGESPVIVEDFGLLELGTAGIFPVILSDALGCQDTVLVTRDEPAPLVLVATALDAACDGLGIVTLTAIGGSGAYSFEGGTDSAPNYLPVGDHTFTVVDAALCMDQVTVTVSEGTGCGCTYLDATNYDASATSDDGSCLFEYVNPCLGDINNDQIINAADLLIFLGYFGTMCPG